ncbi:uncharacterized mitochondrial protein-like protein [Tanacetum coccineum]
MPNLEDIVYSDDDEEVGAEADMNNLATTVPVSSIPTTRVHKDHPLEQIIGDIQSTPQTRRMIKIEPKKVTQALTDLSWIEAMQDELLQFKLQKVWTLVELPYGKRAIGTKWVYRNKKDDRGSGPDWLFDIDLLTNSMNYKPVTAGNQTNRNAGIKDNVDDVPTQQYILLPLLSDSLQSSEDAVVDDVGKKTTEEPANMGERNGQEKEGGASNKEGYANSTNRVSTVSPSVSAAGQSFDNADDLPTDPLMPDLEDTIDLLNTGIFSGAYDDDDDEGAEANLDNLETTMNVYVDDIIFGSTKKSLCVEFEQMMHKRFQMSSIGELTFFLGLQIASTPIETNKALLKDEEAKDVDGHLYRSMIGSLMYLIASRPDIMFIVCACARFQLTPKVLHLHVVKRIFRYLKGQPKLGLCYPRDSPFDLEASSDSDYAGASLDRKSTTRDGISDEFGVKTGSCKVNVVRQDLVLLGEMDFLNFTHIKYALTENPTIYALLIYQFWQTASASTSENGEMKITATIDGRVKTVTKASIRRHLKLEDSDSIITFT